MEEKKLFEFRLEEHNGEQEYSYDQLVYADSIEQAEHIAEEYVKTFYGEDGPEWEDDYGNGVTYYFDNGHLGVKVSYVREIIKEAWMAEQFHRCMIYYDRAMAELEMIRLDCDEAACVECGWMIGEDEIAFVKPDEDGSRIVYCERCAAKL